LSSRPSKRNTESDKCIIMKYKWVLAEEKEAQRKKKEEESEKKRLAEEEEEAQRKILAEAAADNPFRKKYKLNYAFLSLGELNGGSSGDVGKATLRESDVVPPKVYAVKMPNESPGSIFMIRNEIKMLKKVQGNEHFPQFIEEIENLIHGKLRSYLIMEWIDGKDLDKYMGCCALSEKEGLGFIRQVIEGIEDLHKKGIAHKDLKPKNLMVVNNDIKIIDFAFAEEWDSNGRVSERAGTPAYMAPELFERTTGSYSYDAAKLDIWSCGVTLFEMLNGDVPFKGNEPTDYDSIEHRKDISDEVKKLIGGMLERKPENRWTIKQIKVQIEVSLIAQPDFFYHQPAGTGWSSTYYS